ncbi:hypothetical protein ACDA63_19805 [Uliginosibacterium sp. sgz301328]|uniref:hypothetical protein n=1 Tax=Uliginosibacterium sp. sgz301328 TaxID=3243764 RepID=UPI00359DA09F
MLSAAVLAAPASAAVKEVLGGRLEVVTPEGRGQLAIATSQDWNAPLPQIERAVVVFHGVNRDAANYLRYALTALRDAGASESATLIVTPQFLSTADVRDGLADDLLRWRRAGWEDGLPAAAPASISSFEAIDAILARLSDRTRFPALREVVLAGHSGGGQVVQRYAVVGQGEAALAARAVSVRYVVANPSSYLYFSNARPTGDSTFAPVNEVACPTANRWKYGWADAPAYARALSPAAYEARYVARDVIYLLGGADIRPDHPALDKSCAGEAQGAWRLARGQAYVTYLRQGNPALGHRAWIVPKVGHDAGRMFDSACGRAALFDLGGCRTVF